MLYDNAYNEFSLGNIAWRRKDGDRICAVLVDTEYYSPYRSHAFLDRVPMEARVGIPRRLLLCDVKEGKHDAEDLPFTGIVKRQKVGGIVVFKDCGTDDTSPLIAFVPVEGDPKDVFMVAYVRWAEMGIFNMDLHGAIAVLETGRPPLAGAEWAGYESQNAVQITSGKLEAFNVYGKVENFPFRPEVEPWVPPYLPEFPPDRWDDQEHSEEKSVAYPYHNPLVLPPWALPHGQPWHPGDWSPQDGRYPVPFPVKPDWMRPEPIPPHFNPKIEGEWGTAFESKPWIGPRPPLVPVIPEGQDKFFCDPKHIAIRRGASAELRFYLADAHDHLIWHLGERNRDVTFSMKRLASDGSEMRLTLEDKIVFLPTIPGEPIVVMLDQDETLVEGIHLFELVLRLGDDRYLASYGAIEITPAFGTIGDAKPKRLFPDLIYVRDYGAKGDGETDDTQAFLDAKAAAGDTGTVYVHAGKYCLSDDIEGRFVALGVVEFTCVGSASLTNLRDDFVHLFGDETIHGVKTFADTPIFASGIDVHDWARIGGGADIKGGVVVGGGLVVSSGDATFASSIDVGGSATIHSGAIVSGGMIVSGTISGYVTSAGHANTADSATYAGSAASAVSAGSAGSAGYAASAGQAASAASAGSAGSAASAGVATALGSATVGGSARPVYVSSGAAVVCGATIGGSARPVWMSSGTITPISGDIGNANTPVYVSGGVLTPCTVSSGGGNVATAIASGALNMFTLHYGDTGGGAQIIEFPSGGKWRVMPHPAQGTFTRGYTYKDVTVSAVSSGGSTDYEHTFTTDTGGSNWDMNFIAIKLG